MEVLGDVEEPNALPPPRTTRWRAARVTRHGSTVPARARSPGRFAGGQRARASRPGHPAARSRAPRRPPPPAPRYGRGTLRTSSVPPALQRCRRRSLNRRNVATPPVQLAAACPLVRSRHRQACGHSTASSASAPPRHRAPRLPQHVDLQADRNVRRTGLGGIRQAEVDADKLARAIIGHAEAGRAIGAQHALKFGLRARDGGRCRAGLDEAVARSWSYRHHP